MDAGNNVADRLAIMDSLGTYSVAIDSADLKLLRSVFTTDASITLLEPVGIDGFCDFVKQHMEIVRTQHFVSGTVISIAGDTAHSISYVQVFQRVPGGCEDDTCAAIYGRYAENMHVITGGRYHDKWARTSTGWKLAKRNIEMLWQSHQTDGRVLPAGWTTAPCWLTELR